MSGQYEQQVRPNPVRVKNTHPLFTIDQKMFVFGGDGGSRENEVYLCHQPYVYPFNYTCYTYFFLLARLYRLRPTVLHPSDFAAAGFLELFAAFFPFFFK